MSDLGRFSLRLDPSELRYLDYIGIYNFVGSSLVASNQIRISLGHKTKYM